MKIECYGATDVGRVREANEDSIRIDPERNFVMVADGVGGSVGGAVASGIAVEVVHRHMAEEIDRIRAEGGTADQTNRFRLTKRMEQALESASSTIYARGQADLSLRGMGTTSVVLQVLGNWALIGHVGDSRVYLFRGSKPYQITEDHSLVRLMLARGAITAEEAESYPNKNVIVRAVGMQPNVEVDVICFDLMVGDTLLLCSDGLSDPVPHDQLMQMTRDVPLPTAARSLIDRANQNGGPDNISVALLRASGDAAAPAAQPAVRMELKVELLQHVGLFKDLTFQEAARMLGYVHEQRFTQGQVVCNEGDSGDWFYIVAEGAVEVSQGGMLLTTIERGGHFGELGLVTDAVRSATVRAARPTTLLTITRDALLWLVRHDHALATKLLWGFLANLADRVKALSSQLTEARTAR